MVISEARKRKEEMQLIRPRVLVDLDGTVVEYNFARIVKEHFKVELPRPIFAYNLADELGVHPDKIDRMFFTQVWGKPSFIEGALETLNSWQLKYDLVIWTNRLRYMKEIELIEWMIDNKIPFHGIDGGQGEYLAHIDDRPSKLAQSNSKLKLLFTQTWNLSCMDLEKQFRRVNSWEEVGRVL